jgi:hypothetical protein
LIYEYPYFKVIVVFIMIYLSHRANALTRP